MQITTPTNIKILETLELLEKDFREQGEVNKSRMYLVKELMEAFYKTIEYDELTAEPVVAKEATTVRVKPNKGIASIANA